MGGWVVCVIIGSSSLANSLTIFHRFLSAQIKYSIRDIFFWNLVPCCTYVYIISMLSFLCWFIYSKKSKDSFHLASTSSHHSPDFPFGLGHFWWFLHFLKVFHGSIFQLSYVSFLIMVNFLFRGVWDSFEFLFLFSSFVLKNTKNGHRMALKSLFTIKLSLISNKRCGQKKSFVLCCCLLLSSIILTLLWRGNSEIPLLPNLMNWSRN